MKTDTENLLRLYQHPSIRIGTFPTPIERIEAYASEFGVDLLVKRDDLSGYGRGGAKTRKLAYLFGWLLDRGYDELITCMGNISNLIFDIIPLIREHGIRSLLLCLDIPRLEREERLLHYNSILPDINLVRDSHAGAAGMALRAYLRGRLAGRKPAIVLPGISHPSAVVGNAMGFVEAVDQLRRANEEMPDFLFVSGATGTTVAGYILAERLLHAAGLLHKGVKIVGVQVYPGRIRQFTGFMLNWTARYLGLPKNHRFEVERIGWDAGFAGDRFGDYDDFVLSAQTEFQAKTGIFLDPIFSGKTIAAIKRWLMAKRIPAGSRILFWHCGYTPNWPQLTSLRERGSTRLCRNSLA